ncbi:MAG: hypothetical protein ACK5Q5_06075 [Planctomycetaceae bacterium]
MELLNSQFTEECAAELAARLVAIPNASTEQRIDALYRLLLGRTPSEMELDAARQSLSDRSLDWRDLCLALLNTNEFIYID